MTTTSKRKLLKKHANKMSQQVALYVRRELQSLKYCKIPNQRWRRKMTRLFRFDTKNVETFSTVEMRPQKCAQTFTHEWFQVSKITLFLLFECYHFTHVLFYTPYLFTFWPEFIYRAPLPCFLRLTMRSE